MPKYTDAMWEETQRRIESIDNSLDARAEIERYRKLQLAENDPVKRATLNKGMMALRRHLMKLEGQDPDQNENYVRGAYGSDPNLDSGDNAEAMEKLTDSLRQRKQEAMDRKAEIQKVNARYQEDLDTMRKYARGDIAGLRKVESDESE